MTVSLSFTLDQGDDDTASNAAYSGGPFDGHSVSVSSDALGTLKLNGEGGASSASSIDGSAAGDIWDTFDGARGSATAVVSFRLRYWWQWLFYSMPSVMDGLDVFASYQPQGSGRESATGFGATYSGFDGLSLSYATTDEAGTTVALSGDQTVYKVSYAYGPITATLSESEFDVGTGTADQTTGSFALSYTVSDEISVTYGSETHDQGNKTVDMEVEGISVAYTAGGMTITGKMQSLDNGDFATGTTNDADYWALGASFAF